MYALWLSMYALQTPQQGRLQPYITRLAQQSAVLPHFPIDLQAFSAWAAPESLTNRAASSTVALLKNLVLMAAALQSHFHFDRVRRAPGISCFNPMHWRTAFRN